MHTYSSESIRACFVVVLEAVGMATFLLGGYLVVGLLTI